MTSTATLGFPRIGAGRELKHALERHWSGRLDEAGLEQAAAALRRTRWEVQRDAGIAHIPSNDFSLYDHVLDAACLVGAVPERFGGCRGPVPLATCFAMARGAHPSGDCGHATGCTPVGGALEMTKWFDTNYHYLVPELSARQEFSLASDKPVREFNEALALGIRTRPVLLGPLSFLLLAKDADGGGGSDRLALLPGLLAVYVQVLRALHAAGADWVQIDEPCLVLDLDDATRAAYRLAYAGLAAAAPLRLMLATYFGGLGDNLPLAASLPVAGLHLDLVRAPGQLAPALDLLPPGRHLSLGLVDGRNVWRCDLDAALALAREAHRRVGGERLQLAPSCSLLHVPLGLDREPRLDAELRGWLAFAQEKLGELRLLGEALDGVDHAPALAAARLARGQRLASPRVRDPRVEARLGDIPAAWLRRGSGFAERSRAQQRRLGLPPLPTTTIGSFPQTAEVRAKRAAWRAGTLGEEDYQEFLRAETVRCLRIQEELGLDLLVHGEFERTDMVEHFGEQLAGFAFTANGWVQSYGSRCVKPPIIVGDVSRPRPMTVGWARFAQAQTPRPVKGMLTGPVTILQWSFVRDDRPREVVCRQLALAIRDEVADLEGAGIAAIQIDEPALREGLPLRHAERAAYLAWAVDCFRLATAVARDDTQIHTHMCYGEFADIMPAIAALDADVISIETARSRLDLLDAFQAFSYPNGIGPGVYDIHSPHAPDTADMAGLLRHAASVLPRERLWVNPDCGLKTRSWAEVRPALAAMVEAARLVRGSPAPGPAGAGVSL